MTSYAAAASAPMWRHLNEKRVYPIDARTWWAVHHVVAGWIQRRVDAFPIPNGQRPYVEPCFTTSQRFAAHSGRLFDARTHHYGIILSHGALGLLADAFARMLAHRDCFPDVGNPDLEVIAEPTLDELDTSTVRIDALGDRYVFPQPRCPLRNAYAVQLTTLAGVGIASHELGHIAQGHLLLMQQAEPDGLSLLDLRALELMADGFAARRTSELARHQDRAVFPTEEAAIRAATRALQVPLLFHPGAFAEAPTDDPKYPSPQLRQGFSCQALEKMSPEHHDAILEGAQSVWRAGRAISRTRLDKEHLALSSGLVESGTLLEHWQVSLRPKLLPLAYVELPTAGEDNRSVYRGY